MTAPEHPNPIEQLERQRGDALAADLAAAVRRADRADAKIESVRALLASEIADSIERRVRSALGDVRCLDCNLRHDERQEYGCHWPGQGHSYDEGDLAAAEAVERAAAVEYVTLSVADLRAALGLEPDS